VDIENQIVYVGGDFNRANGLILNNIAMWYDNSWNTMGSGIGQDVYTIATYQGKVYVGGNFDFAGSEQANNVASFVQNVAINGKIWLNNSLLSKYVLTDINQNTQLLYNSGKWSIVSSTL
jgi:hypothetical protein